MAVSNLRWKKVHPRDEKVLEQWDLIYDDGEVHPIQSYRIATMEQYDQPGPFRAKSASFDKVRSAMLNDLLIGIGAVGGSFVDMRTHVIEDVERWITGKPHTILGGLFPCVTEVRSDWREHAGRKNA